MNMTIEQSIFKEASFIEQSLHLLREHSMETYAHCMRVGALAANIAKFIGMENEKIEQLRICGLMHDIGKLMIPKEILAKESRLTSAEYEQIKSHPYEGYRMVKKYLSHTVADAVLYHHERMDGSGYPYGVKHDVISLEARIIMIADCFDAMTVDRSYKPAITSDEALNELRTLSGKYDLCLCEALDSIVWKENR